MPRVKPAPRESTRLKLTHCIFCGVEGTIKNPITDEHIWSDWLKTIIPRNSTRIESYIKYSDLTDRPPVYIEEPKALMGDVHTKKAKVVCAKCNNEWMSDIVTAAIPVVTNAALGKICSFNIGEQKTLATWLALQTLTADLIAKENVKFPSADLNYMFVHREPPPEFFMSIGTYAGPTGVAFNHNTVPIWSEDQLGNRVKVFSVHTCTTIIDWLYAITNRFDPIVPGFHPEMHYPGLARIWPQTFPDITWPAPVHQQITGRFGDEGSIAHLLATMAGRKLIADFEASGVSTGLPKIP